ncbi:hypothetical protein AC622_11960 [Bacillus sp. FJAT-27916]|nr:hypothetical protein AC622_11960 [Bacillus sp. FJAT-27916]
MKKVIIGIISLFALLVVLSLFFNINISYLLPNGIEWSTKFILPWIILYWVIRLVQMLKHK